MKIKDLNELFIQRKPIKLRNDRLFFVKDKFVWEYHGNAIATLENGYIKFVGNGGWYKLSISTKRRLNGFKNIRVFSIKYDPKICIRGSYPVDFGKDVLVPISTVF